MAFRGGARRSHPGRERQEQQWGDGGGVQGAESWETRGHLVWYPRGGRDTESRVQDDPSAYDGAIY